MAGLAEFAEIIGPSSKPAPSVDWDRIEGELGLALPSDFKLLCSQYHTLEIDSFLHLRIVNPIAYSPRAVREGILETLAALLPNDDVELEVVDDDNIAYEERVFAQYPAKGGLLPWGFTWNGDLLTWETVGEPDKWGVFVTDGAYGWRHAEGMLDFLGKALGGTIRCPILPNNGLMDNAHWEYTREELDAQ
ncbi:hypothetical protein [Microbispora sp. H10885]|uniref:hypothetical protein n=1 Tax=Microbispora sp. H10885 TaxID=2729110 RepID=UPI0015FFD923|nr:hypothetical protein [Microbispora sp. H10885]